MGNKIMQETTPLVECSAFHRGMSVLEASLRNTEDSETIISGLLKGAAEFYGASRASVVEADWDLGIGVITYEWCKDGVPAQRDTLADGASVRSSAPRPPVRRNSASKDGQIRCRAIPTQAKAALASCPRHDPVSPQ